MYGRLTATHTYHMLVFRFTLYKFVLADLLELMYGHFAPLCRRRLSTKM